MNRSELMRLMTPSGRLQPITNPDDPVVSGRVTTAGPNPVIFPMLKLESQLVDPRTMSQQIPWQYMFLYLWNKVQPRP